jgi:hypothetical protein
VQDRLAQTLCRVGLPSQEKVALVHAVSQAWSNTVGVALPCMLGVGPVELGVVSLG